MKVLLICFYNPKALGIRYLEKALTSAGHTVRAALFKSFNSVRPSPATEIELGLLRDLVTDFKPDLIGLSVMASVYMESVEAVHNTLREHFDIPLMWGGAYVSLFPEKCLEKCDYLIRGEGEDAIIELANALEQGTSVEGILNLAYHGPEGVVVNKLRPLLTDMDKFGLPEMGGTNKFLIENNTIRQTDPQVHAVSYETGAGRGCPFSCTYCTSVNLLRMNAGGGRYVRFRDVDRVIEELKYAKSMMKKLVVVHFWDEIFSDDGAWIDRFVKRYKAEINLPFEIWGHPLKTNHALIEKLCSAGLYKVVMGIQSGSIHIRKDIFHRPETQQDVLAAAQVLKDCKVPQVIYDFMLRHPFETEETIRETFDLCMALPQGFELQMHGLNFLPGSDIVQMALDANLVTPEEMDRMMHAGMEEQYSSHWKRDNNNPAINFWFHLIYLSQFKTYRKAAKRLSEEPMTTELQNRAETIYKQAMRLERPRYYYNKAFLVLRGLFG